MRFVAQQSVDEAVNADGVNGRYNHGVVLDLSWNLVRCLSLDPADPFDVFWHEAHLKQTCVLVAQIALECLDCNGRVYVLNLVLFNAVNARNEVL